MKKEETLKIILKGYVQGVGMRYFIKTSAEKLNITGYVQNDRSGSVTILANGYKKDLHALLHKIKHQSPGDIDDIITTKVTPNKPFEQFTVNHP
ncbi:MAG: acylphosphatase [Bacillota bacterium]